MSDQYRLRPLEHTRRSFCTNACQAATLLAFGSLVPACGGNATGPSGGTAPPLTSLTGSVSGGRVTVSVDTSSPLATVGGAAIIRAGGSSYLAARTSTDAITVLTAVCTHEGCIVEGFRNSTYVCPCHGSSYNTSGSVITGPATRPLAQLASTFANGLLSFSA